MVKKKAYTLLELVIVIFIISMLALFGGPAFSKYKQNSQFNQKIDEVRELFVLTHQMALIPSDTIVTSYQIRVDAVPGSYALVYCTGVVPACSNQRVINSVSLNSGETIQPLDSGSQVLLSCSTQLTGGKDPGCLTYNRSASNLTISTFFDSNSAVSKTAVFTLVNNPEFRIEPSTL